jgi:23S rRNA (guanosine2251-2'-O)-methyltransferase
MRPGHPAQRKTARQAAAAARGEGSGTRATDQPTADLAPGAGSARRSDGPEIVAGRNAVLEALRAKVPGTTLYVAYRTEADDRVRSAIKLAADAGLAVLEAGRAELDRITQGAVHQGLALRVRPYQYAHPDDLTARAADAGQPPLIVALDGVTDPRNLGAIVRSAAAFGGHGVLIPGRRSAGVTAGAWKASAGTLARLPVAQAPNLARALAAYQEAGLFVVGLAADGSTDIADMELAESPLVLVVGSEGKGLSRIVADRCDLLARIPISAAESLNASVAAGVALHEAARRRGTPAR